MHTGNKKIVTFSMYFKKDRPTMAKVTFNLKIVTTNITHLYNNKYYYTF